MAKAAAEADELVALELNPSCGVDVLGDCDPPILKKHEWAEFTKAEAKALLALRNEHGTPLCRNRGAS